jgi:hypothetical protein
MDLRGLSRTAWLGAFFLVLSVSVVSGDRFAGGDGTAVSPYQIASAEQLVVLGSDPNLWDKHFVLIRDLDMARIEPNTIRPIGDSQVEAFTGVFDGQGHVISHLRIVRPDASWVGLFGLVGRPFEGPSQDAAGHIRNLRLTDVLIQGNYAVGGLAGALGSGSIRNCSLTGTVAGKDTVGGLVGWGDGLIDSCSAAVQVHGVERVAGLVAELGLGQTVLHCSTSGRVRGERWVGGLVGMCSGTVMAYGLHDFSSPTEQIGLCRIIQCRSDCSVHGTEAVGGLIGFAHALGEIQDCYALGPVAGSSNVGGLVGLRTGCGLVRCFSAGRVTGNEDAGGLIGETEPLIDDDELQDYPPCQYIVEQVQESEQDGATSWLSIYRPGVLACFWDSQASGMMRPQGAGSGCEDATALTTDQMKQSASFCDQGWDFADVWTMHSGRPYPRLRWEQTP